ncbi:hypothetical protein AB0875_28225 [Micromonospora gifhornensis]|uniref:hypothetical protein n=1 Tax=Micromonospora gifhornensis TaxID=84594 RepID=UPI0034565991
MLNRFVEAPWQRHDRVVVEAAGARWFPDEIGRHEGEIAFLEQLRREASGWDVDGLSPEDDTSSQVWLAPLYVDVDVPGLTIRRRTLQVGYWTNGPFGQALHGVWGDDYLLDDHDGNDPENLTVVGVRASHENYAQWAAAWLLRQLKRPVVREEWLTGDRVAAATWRLDDTGRVLARHGNGFRRLMRRRADRVVTVR